MCIYIYIIYVCIYKDAYIYISLNNSIITLYLIVYTHTCLCINICKHISGKKQIIQGQETCGFSEGADGDV